MTPEPSLSVLVCASTLDRWDELCAAVASVQAQRGPVGELLTAAALVAGTGGVP